MVTHEEVFQLVRSISAEYMAKVGAEAKTSAKYKAVLDQVEKNSPILNAVLKAEGHLWKLITASDGPSQTQLILIRKAGSDALGKDLFQKVLVGSFSYDGSLEAQRVYFTDSVNVEHDLDPSSERGLATSVDDVFLQGVELALNTIFKGKP